MEKKIDPGVISFEPDIIKILDFGIKMQIIKINEEEAGRRLDKFLLKYFDAAPLSFVYKNLRKKNIKLCRKKADGTEILKAGDEIELYFSGDTLVTLSSFAARLLTANDDEIDIAANKEIADKEVHERNTEELYKKYCSIVYEDNQLIIADKKAGVLSQKAKPGDISINEVLLDYVKESKKSLVDASCTGVDLSTFVPSICNRLDRNTSGLITFAKTYAAARELNSVFKERSMHKYYLTIVEGFVSEKKHIKSWLIKDEKNNKVRLFDKEIEGAALIETAYEPIKIDVRLGEKITLLKVELITGKTHQIRAHLASTGHPVLGDIKYGNSDFANKLKKKYGIRNHILHSYMLELPDSMGGGLEYLKGKVFTADPPEVFKKLGMLP